MKMAAKLATGTAMNEDVTVLLQGGVVKNQVRHFLALPVNPTEKWDDRHP
jgi:translation initiation factor 1 (eIF-1/SUI1)